MDRQVLTKSNYEDVDEAIAVLEHNVRHSSDSLSQTIQDFNDTLSSIIHALGKAENTSKRYDNSHADF